MRISSRDSGSRSHSSRSESRSHGSYSRDSGSCCCDSDPYSRDFDDEIDARAAAEVGAENVYRAIRCADGHIRPGNMDGSICTNPQVYDGPPPRGIEGFLRRNGGGNDSHSRDRSSSRTSSGRSDYGSSTRRLEHGSSSTSRRDSSSSSSSRRDSSGRPSSRPSAAGGELALYGERSSASRHPSTDERSSARYSDDRSSTRHSGRESSRRY